MIALAVATLLAASATPDVTAQADLACATSAEEAALIKATRAKLARMPDPGRLRQFPDRYPTEVGCGLWRLTVGRDGRIQSLALVRKDGRENFQVAVEPWLAMARFKPSKLRWHGLMSVTIKVSDEDDAK